MPYGGTHEEIYFIDRKSKKKKKIIIITRKRNEADRKEVIRSI